MSTVLIIGASRGIGHEFARQYAQAGDRVLATYRKLEDAAALKALGAEALRVDVTQPADLAALAQRLAQEHLDVAIINAGVYGPRTEGMTPVTREQFDLVMHTNVWAPLQLMSIVAPALLAARGKLALLSSRMGSIALMNDSSGWLYRASKAAANSVLRVASLELGGSGGIGGGSSDAPRGVVCMAFHPGWVQTDMGGAQAQIDVATSVSGMRRVIAAANDSHNGKFLNYTGAQLDW